MDSIINDRMTKIFGANWRTSVFGGGALLFGGLSTQPDLFSFLTPEHAAWIMGVSKLLAYIFGTLFVFACKDGKVTGGTVPSTLEAVKRVEDEKALKAVALNSVNK